MNFLVPPEYANNPPNGRTTSGSVGRSERMGPTRSESVDWKTTRNRVRPPSTCSSYTTSAELSPACGRASGAFSIFTVSAGRAAVAALVTGRPVNGYCAGTVVVVGGGFGRARATSFFLLPPQAPATSTRATTAAMGRRTVWLRAP